MRKLIYLLLSICTCVSCIDDESKLGTNALSTLSFVTSLNESYTCEHNNQFVLTAPETKQENRDKTLSYEWQVNYKVVSTAKDLNYTCEGYGEFPCRLKISNEDGAIFHEFTLKIPYPYEKGVMLLSRYDGRSMMSFRGANDASFIKDIYRLHNPSVELGKEPKGIAYNERMECVYIATENPLRVVKVEHNTMDLLDVLPYPEERVEALSTLRSMYTLYFTGGGRIVKLDCGSDTFENGFQQYLTGEIMGMFPDAYLANNIVSPLYAGEPMFTFAFDTNSKSFLLWDEDSYVDDYVCLECQGMSLVAMFLRNTYDVVLVMKDGDEFKIFEYNINYDDTAPEVSATSSGMNDKSVFMLDEKKGILYYTDGGNNIFRYNLISKGNFEPSDYTVGNDGDVIQGMLLDQDEGKLYVAVNAKEGDYRGCVYCYNSVTKELLWEERGVAGEIVQMIYKDK